MKGDTMNYIYETHSHTSEASACGMVAGKDYITYMKQKGYSGMIITDHFFNGNSCVPRSLPWKDRVDLYCSGFDHAFEASRGRHFSVFFGIEFNFEGDEYLLYGVDKSWLLEQGDILTKSRKEVYTRVHQGGGIMIQAHPYRERGYLKDIRLTPSVSDGIEIYNAANGDHQNVRALAYARDLQVPVTAGSDIHYFHDKPLGGMMFSSRLESTAEFAEQVMAGSGIPVSLQNGNVIPVYELDEMKEEITEPGLEVLFMTGTEPMPAK